MGIKGIYAEIGPGDRIALSKLAIEFLEKQQRPLRLAIDISIWLFQIQSSEGGSNPALRTFYYRVLRLISLSIHPVFVFDGPNKPPFKRNKRTLGPGVKTTSIPEFLAKQLLESFALPMHFAPGEAEAECALLQRLGHVDAVLSEDADTLMFGSQVTIRNLSPQGSLKTKIATHVNVYDAQKVRNASGLDRQGMILVALMSGGDYVPEGIPRCGPKIACEAARAGFGAQLCAIDHKDDAGLAAWKERLEHELRTNESKFFARKHCALKIPQDFPRREILRFYTHPCVSSSRELSNTLEKELQWDRDIDINALRKFTANAFEWCFISGAKKFIRNLAPALLVKELRLRASRPDTDPDNTKEIERQENCLIKGIHLKRNHVLTDRTTELRVGFIPLELVALDLDAEPPDPETTNDVETDEEDAAVADANEGLLSPKKKRGPSTYDPTKLEKVWLLESILKMGVPLKVQDWEESVRAAEQKKSSRTRAGEANKSPKKANRSDMPPGALDRFARVVKPVTSQAESMTSQAEPVTSQAAILKPVAAQAASQASEAILTEALTSRSAIATHNDAVLDSSLSRFRVPQPLPAVKQPSDAPIISLLSSPEQPEPKRRLCRSKSTASGIELFGQGEGNGAPRLLQASAFHGATSRRGLELQLELSPSPPPSPTLQRSGSPMHRTATVSKNPLGNISKAPTPSRTLRAGFQKPPDLPGLPLCGTFAKAPVSAESHSPTLEPSLASDRSVEIISLCSPPTTPSRRTGKPTNRAPLIGTSASFANVSLPLRPQLQKPDQGVETGQGAGNTIRLRESLAGAWQIEHATRPEQDEGFQARKRKRTQWRVSQVEVLDLTGV